MKQNIHISNHSFKVRQCLQAYYSKPRRILLQYESYFSFQLLKFHSYLRCILLLISWSQYSFTGYLSIVGTFLIFRFSSDSERQREQYQHLHFTLEVVVRSFTEVFIFLKVFKLTMSLNRIVSKALPLARSNVMFNQVRHEGVIASPPTFRMPFFVSRHSSG